MIDKRKILSLINDILSSRSDDTKTSGGLIAYNELKKIYMAAAPREKEEIFEVVIAAFTNITTKVVMKII